MDQQLPNNDEQTPQTQPSRPARPYSYYVATNFHPFDLSVLCQQLEERQEQERAAAAAAAAANIREKSPTPLTTEPPNRESTIRSSKRSRKSKQKQDNKQQEASKRLSMSLSDIKTPTTATTATNNESKLMVNDDVDKPVFKMQTDKRKSKSNQLGLHKGQNFDEYDDDYDGLAENSRRRSSTSVFKRATGFTSTMPAKFARAINPSRVYEQQTQQQQQSMMLTCEQQQQQQSSQPISGKINRFFRHLFRVGDNKSHGVSSHIDEEVGLNLIFFFFFDLLHKRSKIFQINLFSFCCCC